MKKVIDRPSFNDLNSKKSWKNLFSNIDLIQFRKLSDTEKNMLMIA